MCTDFISFTEPLCFRYYGIVLRLDVIFVDSKPSIWLLSQRTCNHKDEFTKTFDDFEPAFQEYKSLAKALL